MANEIRVTVTGDDELSGVVEKATGKAEADIKGLAATADTASSKMGRDFDAGFDKLGEGAGGAEQKFVGLSDSITGTQDVMAGLKSGNVQQVAMGMADLAGAAEALWASMGKVIVNIGKKIAAQASELASTLASTAATVAHGIAQAAVATATAVWTAAQWLLNAALTANPIGLVVLAIVALVAALVLAWQHSETFRAIVTGAFDAVMSVVSAVWHWVADNWPLLLGILTGPIGLAVGLIITYWDQIKDGVTGVWHWIDDRFNDITNIITGIPGRIASAASGMWDGIKDAFKSAVNWIIDKWNGLSFGLPGFDPPGPGPSFPGFTIRVPQIPRFARGGITAGPMLAMVGDNPGGREAIIPLGPGQGGALGGHVTVVVQALDARSAEEGVTRALEGAYRRGLLPRPAA